MARSLAVVRLKQTVESPQQPTRCTLSSLAATVFTLSLSLSLSVPPLKTNSGRLGGLEFMISFLSLLCERKAATARFASLRSLLSHSPLNHTARTLHAFLSLSLSLSLFWARACAKLPRLFTPQNRMPIYIGCEL